jgi:plastocyanin
VTPRLAGHAAIAGIATLAAAIPAGPTAHATTKTVAIRDIAFKPGRVTINRGDGVRFLWRDRDVPHNVTSKGTRRFASSPTRKSGGYIVRPATPGTYRYVCTIHFGMTGTITVK